MESLRQALKDLSFWWQSQDYQPIGHASETDTSPNFKEKGVLGLGYINHGIRRLSTKAFVLLVASIIFIPALLTISTRGVHNYISSPGDDVAEDGTAEPWDGYDVTSLPEPIPGNRRFVVVIPANGGNPELCKLVSSAIILGYPSPVIVNWGKKFIDHKDGWFGGTHLSKIVGTLDYMDKISHNKTHKGDKLRDNDIVLVVDAFDLWFQLPPEILLQRYHDAIRAANARLAGEWPGTGEMPMQQTIIISTQKKCFPPVTAGSNLHCDALPESTLPKDVYGPDTDVVPEVKDDLGVKGNPRQYHDVRPRYLNSGSIMGPLGDMKRYFRRVKAQMDKSQANGTRLYSDQGVFGEVFAEQEIWRTWLRERHASNQELPNDEGTGLLFDNFEYHVGLDYSQQLFLATVFEEDDGEIFKLNNHSLIANRSQELGISPIRLQGVPEDVKTARNPMKGIKPKADYVAPEWGDMAMYADFFTTAIPPVVHHNAHAGGLKRRREWWWPKMWYFPYLRPLLKAGLKPGPLKPLATVPVRDGDVVYWAPSSDEKKRNARIYEEERLENGLQGASLNMVCRHWNETADWKVRWFDEVFRDGKGPLKLD
ncbi:Fc.00g001170.m01.CDS01 [Cosmosporella sp. VM-42]